MTWFLPSRSLFSIFSCWLPVTDFHEINFVDWVGIILIRECQKANYIDKGLELNFLQNYRVDHFAKRCNRIAGRFGGHWHKNLRISLLHWNLGRPESPELFVTWAQFDFRKRVSPNQVAWFLLSSSDSKTFSVCWKILLKVNGILLCSGDLINQNCQEMQLNLTWQVFQTHIFSAPLASFLHRGFNRYPSFWGPLFNSNFLKGCFILWSWSCDWPEVAKVLFVLGFPSVPTRLSPELLIWLLVSRSELTLI